MADWRRAIVFVVAKAPRLGHGKSRLAAGLGAVEALRINRALHRMTMRAVVSGPWQAILAVSPDQATTVAMPHIWPVGLQRVGQGEGDLGARLARLADRARHRAVVLIGTDCPTLGARHIGHALRAVRCDPVHAIPATDGGFVLLAASKGQHLRGAFQDVRWSSEHTLRDVCDNLARAGQRISLAPALADIDTAGDWREAMRARLD